MSSRELASFLRRMTCHEHSLVSGASARGRHVGNHFCDDRDSWVRCTDSSRVSYTSVRQKRCGFYGRPACRVSSEAHFCGGTGPFRLRGPTFARRHRFSGVLAQAPPTAAFRPAGVAPPVRKNVLVQKREQLGPRRLVLVDRLKTDQKRRGSSRDFAFSLISSMGIDPRGRRNSMTFRMQNPPKIRP